MDDLIKDADEYRDAVAEFIRSKGITRCPTACVLPTQGLIAAADRIALEQHALVRDRVKRERAAARWGRFLPLKCPQEHSLASCQHSGPMVSSPIRRS
jgi:hypothetical protein